MGLSSLDTGDEILYRVRSNPISLTVTPYERSQPATYNLSPSAAPASRPGAPSEIVIKEIDFGESQGTSEFSIGGRTWYEGYPKIRSWSDDTIEFKVPAYKNWISNA